MDKTTRETAYSSKSAAINAMWRYYDRHIRWGIGSPLVGEAGTVLQWCDNGGHTNHMTVTHNDRDDIILIRSWLE